MHSELSWFVSLYLSHHSISAQDNYPFLISRNLIAEFVQKAWDVSFNIHPSCIIQNVQSLDTLCIFPSFNRIQNIVSKELGIPIFFQAVSVISKVICVVDRYLSGMPLLVILCMLNIKQNPTLSSDPAFPQANQKTDHPTFEDTAAIPTFFDNRGKTAPLVPIFQTDP